MHCIFWMVISLLLRVLFPFLDGIVLFVIGSTKQWHHQPKPSSFGILDHDYILYIIHCNAIILSRLAVFNIIYICNLQYMYSKYDMIWYDMTWHDMIWHDVMWCDMYRSPRTDWISVRIRCSVSVSVSLSLLPLSLSLFSLSLSLPPSLSLSVSLSDHHGRKASWKGVRSPRSITKHPSK